VSIPEGCFVPEIELRSVTLAYGDGPARITALNAINLKLTSGTFTVIAGPSGSGKTSLISIIGAMIAPDSGSVVIDNSDITKLTASGRSTFRRDKIGFIFQSFRLMSSLSAEENVRLALEIKRIPNIRKLALEALETVGLASKGSLLPDQMSHGEKQRVAVARAIAHRPSIVLADEPTASLDAASGAQVTQLLRQIAHVSERLVVAVTHDPRVLPMAQRVIQLADGRITGDQLCRA
jgi:putative ABC transport system ATP-binding protein